MISSIIFQVQAFLIVGLLLFGVYKRRNRSQHVFVMRTAIIWDLILVAQIELTRQAINTASKAMDNHWLLNFHISLAVSTVLLYFVILYTGQKLLSGQESIRKSHKYLGFTTLTLRILTLITSNIIREIQ